MQYVGAQLILVLLSVVGAIIAAVLGWVESGEPFDQRKFLASVFRAVLAGLFAALVFQDIENITLWTFVVALLYGAGFDVLGHRAAGAISRLRE